LAGNKKSKKKQTLFSPETQEKQCIEFLNKRGYGVFRVDDSISDAEEADCVRKLKTVGYKIEHIRDSIVKVDPTKIMEPDDVAVYFYEKLKRHSKIWFDPDKLRSKQNRKVDCSVVNSYVRWRINENSLSLNDIMVEMFILIDTLFEKAVEWELEIRSIGILSVNNNKPFILSLLKEVNVKKDLSMQFITDHMILNEDNKMYFQLLEEAKEEMAELQNAKRTKKKKRKIEM
jgi:hypothetical protein